MNCEFHSNSINFNYVNLNLSCMNMPRLTAPWCILKNVQINISITIFFIWYFNDMDTRSTILIIQDSLSNRRMMNVPKCGKLVCLHCSKILFAEIGWAGFLFSFITVELRLIRNCLYFAYFFILFFRSWFKIIFYLYFFEIS